MNFLCIYCIKIKWPLLLELFFSVIINSSEMTRIIIRKHRFINELLIFYLCLPSCLLDNRLSLVCVLNVNRSVCLRFGRNSFSDKFFARSTFSMYLSIKSGQFKCSSGSHESDPERYPFHLTKNSRVLSFLKNTSRILSTS